MQNTQQIATVTATAQKRRSSLVFWIALILTATGAGVGIISPPIALLAGAAYGFTFVHPYARESASVAKLLLQTSVVLLGFGVNLAQVLRVGRSGFVYTAIGITASLIAGLLLGRLLHVQSRASFLIASGTAICGGSAIAALAPILQADDTETSVAMGTVFLLNSVALLLFPAVGSAMHLTQTQFGLWAALAIHDTSSVVGAAAKYGDTALAIGTTVKLARALWIVPLSLVTAAVMRRREHDEASHAKVTLPWFILLFCLASVLRTELQWMAAPAATLNRLGKAGLVTTLFLIGTSLSKNTLQQAGPRPLLQGLVLWVAVSAATLWAIHAAWIAL